MYNSKHFEYANLHFIFYFFVDCSSISKEQIWTISCKGVCQFSGFARDKNVVAEAEKLDTSLSTAQYSTSWSSDITYSVAQCLLLVLLLTSVCYLHYRITILAYCIVINEYYHLLWLFKNEWMNGCILCYSFPGLVFVDFFPKKSGFAAFLLLVFFSEWIHFVPTTCRRYFKTLTVWLVDYLTN